MMERQKQGWAIVGQHGLYIGWHVRRIDMIAEHVKDVRRLSEPETHGLAIGGRLNPDQAAIWRRCKRRGDKAVKVKISY